MKQVKLPPGERFKEHIQNYFRSLLQFKEHFAPWMNARFGTNWPEYNAYVCPVCLQNLLVLTDNKLYGTSSFDLDHYPPESVGGKNTVIVCEPCNNAAGINFEHELVDFLNQQSFNLNFPKASVKATAVLTYKDKTKLPGNYKVKVVKQDDGKIEVDWGNAINQPYVIEWMSHLEKKNRDWELTLTFLDPDYIKVSKALVKSAYLYCFCQWGYEFAFSDQAEKMRQVFAGNLNYPMEKGCNYFIADTSDLIPNGVAFIDKPESARNLVVNIPLFQKETGFKGIAGIVIPKPIQSGWDELVSFKFKDEEVEVKNLAPHDINHQLNGYSLAWENVSKGLVKELPPKPV